MTATSPGWHYRWIQQSLLLLRPLLLAPLVLPLLLLLLVVVRSERQRQDKLQRTRALMTSAWSLRSLQMSIGWCLLWALLLSFVHMVARGVQGAGRDARSAEEDV
jgi:hypothetical protein